MDKKKYLLNVLNHGLLEIRSYSQRRDSDRDRVNNLSELLHNIPTFIDNAEAFDFTRLEREIKEHKRQYTHSLLPEKN